MAGSDKSLGPLIATYRGGGFVGGGFLLLLALAVIAPLGYGFYRAQYAYTKYGPVAARFWSRPWYLLTALALLVAAVLVFIRLARSRRYIAVHQNGLRLRLSRRQQLTWSELSGIATGVQQTRLLGKALRTRYEAVLYPTVGAALRLDSSLKNLPELLTRIKANLYPRLLPGMQKAFQDKKLLYFGPIAIQQEALRLQEKGQTARTIPWSQVQSINVQAGMLVIDVQSQPDIRLPVARVPNLELLLQIIHSGVNA